MFVLNDTAEIDPQPGEPPFSPHVIVANDTYTCVAFTTLARATEWASNDKPSLEPKEIMQNDEMLAVALRLM